MKTPKNLLKGSAVQSSRQHRPSMGPAPTGAATVPELRRAPAPLPAAAAPARTTAPVSPAPLVDAEELRRIQEQARREGFAQGLEEAKAEAEKLQREQSQRLRQLMDSLAEAAQAHRAHIESRLADFAFVAVTRMLGEVAVPPDARVACVRAALKACEPWHEATVEVNAADAVWVARALAEGAAPGASTPKILPSSAVRVGGCRVVHGDDTLDARFETQLELLHAALSAARRR